MASPSGVAGVSQRYSYVEPLPAIFVLCGVIAGMLPSVFIGWIPLPFIGFIAVLAGVVIGGWWHRVLVSALLIGVVLAALVFHSVLQGVAPGEVIKAAIGAFSFLFVARVFPLINGLLSSRLDATFRVFLWVQVAAFLLTLSGLVDFRQIGLVSYYRIEDATTYTDLRSSGLYGEPSWYALALFALCWRLETSRRLALWEFLGAALTMVLCQSAIGALCVGVLFARRLAAQHGTTNLNGLLWRMLMVCTNVVILTFSTLLLAGYLDEAVVNKLLDPMNYGSGPIRLLTPLPLAADVARLAPLFGFGLASLSEQYFGSVGTSILPLNVFIEMGIVGVLTYGVTLWRNIWRGVSGVEVFAHALILLSIGMNLSAFNALLFALIGTRRVAAADHGS